MQRAPTGFAPATCTRWKRVSPIGFNMTKGRNVAAAGRDAPVQTAAYPAESASSASKTFVEAPSAATPEHHSVISMHGVENRASGLSREGSGLDLSRPTSIFGKPEDDICFPTEARTVSAATRLANTPLNLGHDEHTSDVFADSHQAAQLPGVLPGFPFPFDFTALDELATQKTSQETRSHEGIAEAGDQPSYVAQGSLPSSWASSSATFGISPPCFETHDRVRPVSSRAKEGSYHGGASIRKLAAFEAESGVYHGVPSEGTSTAFSAVACPSLTRQRSLP